MTTAAGVDQSRAASGRGPGGGASGDDANTGPRGELNQVRDTVRAPSAVGESGMVFPAGETSGASDAGAPATVPYTDVLSDYSTAAEKALQKERIPPAYRSRVRAYFGSLQE